MRATLGPKKNTIYLQRGFRQYGQPLQETLDGIIDVRLNFISNKKQIIQDENDPYYQGHMYKLCLCDCEHCAGVSPHPVHNCFFKCRKRLVMDEKTIKKLGLHVECHCQCSDCIGMPGHLKRDCFDFCKSSPFTK
jgi:hypothetical protein